MNEEQYIAWVKKSALGWLESGRPNLALVTFWQDLEDRPDLGLSWYMDKGHFLYQAGVLSTPTQIREYIDGLGRKELKND